MDIVSKAKAEYRYKQWSEIIQECQASNMTVKAWCSQHSIGIKAYYYWLRKIRLSYCQTAGDQALPEKQEILPLQFNSQAGTKSGHAAVTIHLGAASIDISEGTSQATIEAVLRSLQNVC